jgi:hypothetical protein
MADRENSESAAAYRESIFYRLSTRKFEVEQKPSYVLLETEERYIASKSDLDHIIY